MRSFGLLTIYAYEFVARDGAGNDSGYGSTGNDGKIGSDGGGVGCAISLGMAVAELVCGLVGMSREAPQGAENLPRFLAADTC